MNVQVQDLYIYHIMQVHTFMLNVVLLHESHMHNISGYA